MPWFGRKDDDDKRDGRAEQERAATAQQQQQRSLELLQAGGIPVHAQERLDELRSRDGSFYTSDLSVNEFLLTKQAGFRALSQVMGSSVYHVGWQSLPGNAWRSWSQSQELTVVTEAMNHARALALGRLSEEARRAGADAVVGVHLTRSEYEWATDVIEFNAVGTAVRLGDAEPSANPSLTNLSGQDFWKLLRAGYWPLGVVAGSTVFYVVGGWMAQMSSTYWGGRMNMELSEFSAGVNLARHRGMGMVHSQARTQQASGVVGVEIDQDQEENEVELGNDQRRRDMIFTFHAIGTAVAPLRQAAAPLACQAVLSLDN